jgi:hypothetical protein
LNGATCGYECPERINVWAELLLLLLEALGWRRQRDAERHAGRARSVDDRARDIQRLLHLSRHLIAVLVFAGGVMLALSVRWWERDATAALIAAATSALTVLTALGAAGALVRLRRDVPTRVADAAAFVAQMESDGRLNVLMGATFASVVCSTVALLFVWMAGTS